MKRYLLAAALTLAASLHGFAPAMAQSCTTTFAGHAAYTNCYDTGGGLGEAMGDIADQMQRQAAINSYRQAHGLPKCSAFPVFHWDGLPGC